MQEIICSGCGEKIHDEDLKIKIQSIRKKINNSSHNFSIEMPIYCCNCFNEHLNVNGWALSMNPYYNLRKILINELLQIFNGIRQRIIAKNNRNDIQNEEP